jgi:hypothetical protein
MSADWLHLADDRDHGGLLWTRQWTFEFHKVLGIYCVAEQLSTDSTSWRWNKVRTTTGTTQRNGGTNNTDVWSGAGTVRLAVLLEKLTVPHLANIFLAFYGIRRFSPVFTWVRYWPLSWARWLQSTPSPLNSSRLILIFSSHLCLGFPRCLSPSEASLLRNDLMTLIVSGAENKLWRFLRSPTSRYSPEHPILKHPQFTRFPCFTAIQKT